MQLPEDTLIEWSTGRDASGEESRAFALDWRDSVTPFGKGRAYNRSIARLGAVLARDLDVLGVNVRFAAGVDGEVDLRIECEAHDRSLTMTRWRPAGGFDRVDDGRPNAAALARAKTIDLVKARVEETSEAISALKRERNRLHDMIEAGAKVGAELAMVDAQVRLVRTEHRRMQDDRKARAIAELEVTDGR